MSHFALVKVKQRFSVPAFPGVYGDLLDGPPHGYIMMHGVDRETRDKAVRLLRSSLRNGGFKNSAITFIDVEDAMKISRN